MTRSLSSSASRRCAGPTHGRSTRSRPASQAVRRADQRPRVRGLLWRTRAARAPRAVAPARIAACYRRAARMVRRGGRHARGAAAHRTGGRAHVPRPLSGARRRRARGRLLERAGDRAALARREQREAISGTGSTCRPRSRATAAQCVRSTRAGDAQRAVSARTSATACRCSDAATGRAPTAPRAPRRRGAGAERSTPRYNLAYLDFLEHRDEAALAGLSTCATTRPRAASVARGARATRPRRSSCAWARTTKRSPRARRGRRAMRRDRPALRGAKAGLFASLRAVPARAGSRGAARCRATRFRGVRRRGQPVWTGGSAAPGSLTLMVEGQQSPRRRPAAVGSAPALRRRRRPRTPATCAATLHAARAARDATTMRRGETDVRGGEARAATPQLRTCGSRRAR